METILDEYKAKLLEVINGSGVPIGVTELLLESILNSVREARRLAIEREKQELAAQENSDNEQ